MIPPDGLGRLSALLHAERWIPTVIVYVRSPASYIASDYQESVKSGINLAQPAAPEYRKRIEKFLDLFGADEVILREYDRAVLKDGDVVKDFAQLISVAPPLAKRLENVSLSTDATRVLFLVNQMISRFGEGKEIRRARQRLQDHIRNLLPGKFDLPENLISGLVDEQDVEWLYSVSSIDFRGRAQVPRTEFSPGELQQFMSEPDPQALETIREYLSRDHGIPTPPRKKEFLIARYFMSFL